MEILTISGCIMRSIILSIILTTVIVNGQPQKCDQTPVKATVLTPSEMEHQLRLSIETKQANNTYLPDQTYVVTLQNFNTTRPFKWFMITAEDPDIDDTNNQEDLVNVDVGTLKPLGGQSRHSERCFKTVEETDNSDKIKVEVHWISPKQNNRPYVRLRAMVGENEEVWYTGENLTLTIYKNDMRPVDSPPFEPREVCDLCSEARYEVIFSGKWSRLTHPLHYPKEPDNNGYSDMIGASHDYNFRLWQVDTEASPGLKLLAEKNNISIIQRDIILNISLTEGVRTLIKGIGHMHPHMHVPSYAIFRVDRFHHLFSLVVSLIPSPDWFLGTSMFELCTDDGWLEESEIPLYPWDAGTANGISYESETSVTQPVDTVQRVQVGSFDEASPFYQMNLNDLKPFATLTVRKVDEYPITDDSCVQDKSELDKVELPEDEEPNLGESKSYIDTCEYRDWGEWTPCEPTYGDCGVGTKIRSRSERKKNLRYFKDSVMQPIKERCDNEQLSQTEVCVIEC